VSTYLAILHLRITNHNQRKTMPSTRFLILLSLATTLDLLFLTLLLWALATHKGARIWVWWVVALAVALLVQGAFCEFLHTTYPCFH
jgi:nitric oxide reductase large subunit